MKTISDVRQSQGGNKRRKLRGNLEDGFAQPSLYLLYITVDHRDHMGAQLYFLISGFVKIFFKHLDYKYLFM